jgi:hypothetical protein
MPLKGSGTGSFTFTYAPKRSVTLDVIVEASAKFDEGFGININKWGNQHGSGFSITFRVLMLAAEIKVVLADAREEKA